MNTNLKSETSKTNGAKSKGPSTPEGKARSSQNSLKHGLNSKQILLPYESRADFNTLRASYFDQFTPATPVEAELVETLATTRWRLRRLATIEANIFDNHMLENEHYMRKQLAEADDEAALAWSFKALADRGQSLQLILRYESTLSRTFDRTLKQLLLLQNHRPPTNQNENLQNEPTPPPVNTYPQEPQPIDSTPSSWGGRSVRAGHPCPAPPHAGLFEKPSRASARHLAAHLFRQLPPQHTKVFTAAC